MQTDNNMELWCFHDFYHAHIILYSAGYIDEVCPKVGFFKNAKKLKGQIRPLSAFYIQT